MKINVVQRKHFKHAVVKWPGDNAPDGFVSILYDRAVRSDLGFWNFYRGKLLIASVWGSEVKIGGEL